MENFKLYLEQEGPNFSKSEEILSFFALPYMPNPQDHPAFKQIFTNKWLNSLKDKIRVVIGKESLESSPILQKMYDKYIDLDKKTDDRILGQVQNLERQLATVKEENSRLKQKINKVENNYEEYVSEILNISKKTVEMLEACRHGSKVTEASMQEIYVGLSKFDKSIKPPHPDLPSEPIQLNYAMIIRDLSALQDDLKICALLQALRWRLTRTSRANRRENMENFVKFNILSTQKPHDTLLDQLLASTRRVKEYLLRLLNVLSSEKIGRVYLLTKEKLVISLVNVLFTEKQDSTLRQNTLGVLQKLSLKKTAQIEMIQVDMLDWLLKILKHEFEGICEYTLEYATALLMNLSLRTLGKEKLCKAPEEVMSLLLKFISHENSQVRTYINGTLYSILTKKKLKTAAFRMGIEKKLKVLQSKADENINRQINFILEQLHQQENDCQTDEAEEEMEEIDEIQGSEEEEDEIDEFEDLDDLITSPQILTGEALLKDRYEKSKIVSAVRNEESKAPINLGSKRADSDKKKSGKVQPIKENTEYNRGFSSRDKIPRTPYQG